MFRAGIEQMMQWLGGCCVLIIDTEETLIRYVGIYITAFTSSHEKHDIFHVAAGDKTAISARKTDILTIGSPRR